MRRTLNPHRLSTPRVCRRLGAVLVALLCLGGAVAGAPADPVQTAERLGVHGGLCVQVGAADTSAAEKLAASGRFLVQVIDAEHATAEAARARLSGETIYGLLSVDQQSDPEKLPYTENLVNLLFVPVADGAKVSAAEANRVLCPGGVLVLGPGKLGRSELETAGLEDATPDNAPAGWLVARKPWPEDMDEWSHPRHAASGNAASHDRQVAPPRRVRWVVGAEAEVRGMVSAGGRNFYAGVLTRDAFNGLRLWNRDILAPDSDNEFALKNLAPVNAPPVSDGKHLYVVEGRKLLALDAASGNAVREYPEAGAPGTVLVDQGILVAVNENRVQALEAETFEPLWNHASSNPRHVVVGGDTVALIQGRPERGEAVEAAALDLHTGEVRWSRADFAWLSKVTRSVYHQGVIAFEVSTLNNDGPDNSIHVVSADDGSVRMDRTFLPGMNHRRQARAMFLDDRLYLLEGGKDKDGKRQPIQVASIDFRTGEVLKTLDGGLAHCFPPVMTSRFMISGEFDLTDLVTGQVDANQITKAACGPDGGWVPANGLIYTTPKHCVCWPMLRGYNALAPERPAGDIHDIPVAELESPLERGVAAPEAPASASNGDDWPSYRNDPWRSGSTSSPAPAKLDLLWEVSLGSEQPDSPIVTDWDENMFVKGPLTSPAIVGDRLVVARPDAHEVVMLDSTSGEVLWRFTANGRVDTTPTLYQGLCLFGTKAGWVYCLRQDDGRVVWRMQAAPVEERIVAYGQVESPWPVPGSVLIADKTAYFAAGRQSLADGGILIFSVDPLTGRRNWVQRLDSVPQTNFYDCSGLEFDNFDLLHLEGDSVGMSRWVFDRAGGEMALDRWAAFARLDTGGGPAMVPRGCWSYAPRHQQRIPSYEAVRPLTVFRDGVLFGVLQGTSTVYRRDFDAESVDQFETKWMTGWAAAAESREGKMPWRSHRLAEKASWIVSPFGTGKQVPSIDALLLTSDRLLAATSRGDLQVLARDDGRTLAEKTLPAPLWDGMAVAQRRLYYTTRDGRLLCLGE